MSIEKDLHKHLQKILPANTNIPPAVKNIGFGIVAIVAILFFSPHISTNNRFFSDEVQTIHTTIVNNGNIPLKDWAELTKQEKCYYKDLIAQRFPEVNQIGKGKKINWEPITEYMAQLGIRANNTRDIFRSSGASCE